MMNLNNAHSADVWQDLGGQQAVFCVLWGMRCPDWILQYKREGNRSMEQEGEG